MRVKVTSNVQLLHAGERFTQGDVTEVDDYTGKDWVKRGWAVEVEDKPTKAAPRKRSG
jgi:hypothetical protein